MNMYYEDLSNEEKILQLVRSDRPLYVSKSGQLKTSNIDVLKEYCKQQQKSEGIALNLFVEWQSKKVMIANLSNKKIKLYTGHHSYGLKHCIEQLSCELVKQGIITSSEYCSNEEFIIAMLQAGFDCVNVNNKEKPSPNYEFYMYPLLAKKPRARHWNYNGTDYWIKEFLEDTFGIIK